MKLVRYSLRRPVTLAMAIATVLVLGLISLRKLPLAFLPQVEFPFIGVVVPYPGGIPSEVERDIARPIEEVLATLGGVREIQSESGEDQTFVGVEFDWGRDVNLMRLEVQEKIDQIRGQLPPQVRDVFLFTFNSNDIPILEGRISAKGRDLSESYELIEQKIIMPLQRIPGVGRVQIDGVIPLKGRSICATTRSKSTKSTSADCSKSWAPPISIFRSDASPSAGCATTCARSPVFIASRSWKSCRSAPAICAWGMWPSSCTRRRYPLTGGA